MAQNFTNRLKSRFGSVRQAGSEKNTEPNRGSVDYYAANGDAEYGLTENVITLILCKTGK
jgi:hypothetical protein